MREILVTGASGLVGSRFVELAKDKYNLHTPDYPDFDLTDIKKIKALVDDISPDVVINFAAFTDVTAAESQRDDKDSSCWKINVEGTKNLVNALSGARLRFIQISTDMVFPGSEEFKGPYKENDKPEQDSAKLTWYGYTKAQAEKVVLTASGDAAVLRIISPVRAKFGPKLDYFRKPLSLFDQGKLYPMFADQQISISFIDEVAQALDKIIEADSPGIFHASSSDVTTPYEIISYLLEKARGVKGVVKKSSIGDFLKTVDSPVRYPKYGGLDASETSKKLAIKFSSTKEIVDKLVQQGISI